MADHRTGRGGRYEAWEGLARERGGELVPGRRGKGPRVRFPGEPWDLTLDTFTVSTGNSSATYTRVFALVQSRDDFHFRIYRRTLLSGLAKKLGAQDIHTGHVVLDRDYMVKGNSESKVVSLLMDARISGILETQKAGALELRRLRGRRARKFPPDTAELRYIRTGVVKERASLVAMLDLVAATADQLLRIGLVSAETMNPPGTSAS